ncbi:MAG: hypothetical protein J6N45_00240 [Alphaproteobacteria bacterium]|nr:hypothetical protein [Alphaproteobacteria bacterium]
MRFPAITNNRAVYCTLLMIYFKWGFFALCGNEKKRKPKAYANSGGGVNRRFWLSGNI